MTDIDTLGPESDVDAADNAAVEPAATLEGEIVSDPGLPCTPEYARELTDRAVTALDTFNDTMREIVRVRAWEPLGYADARSYVLREFESEVGRSHRYRLARVSQVLSAITERLGSDVLDEVEITENALRSVPAGADDALVDDIVAAAQSEAGLDQETVEDLLDARRPENKRRQESVGDSDDDREAWSAHEDAYADRIAAEEESGYLDDPFADTEDAGEPAAARRPASQARHDDAPDLDDTPAATSALAEAATFEQFLRALRQVAEIEALLPGILDYADEEQLADLQDWADQATEVLGKVADAAGDL